MKKSGLECPTKTRWCCEPEYSATRESSLCTTMVEIWPRISKGKLREIPGSIFGNCAFSPPVVEAGATYKDLVGVAALP